MKKPAPKKPKPKTVSVMLRHEVAERARDAAVALAGPPLGLTVTDIVNTGTEREVERLQAEHNGGKKFPPRARAVRRGRPIVR